VQHIFSQAGVFSVSLVVIDQQGLDGTADTSITVVEASTPEPPVVGTSWSLAAYADTQGNLVSLVPGTQITALFAADGTLSGSAGCNTYNATYVLDGASIAITAPAATSLACGEPGGIMEQESAYLSLLPLVRQVQVVDGNLLLLDGNGQELLQYVSP
jgi:heat shock protein HslJ